MVAAYTNRATAQPSPVRPHAPAGPKNVLTEATAMNATHSPSSGHVSRMAAMPAQLSGGEAQRVAIARALANEPRIILADEPTAALDTQRARLVMDLLRRVAIDRQGAILVVTHDEKIHDRFDRIFHLRDGRLESIDDCPGPLSDQPRAIPHTSHTE